MERMGEDEGIDTVIRVTPQLDFGHDSYDLRLMPLRISLGIALSSVPVAPSGVGASFLLDGKD